MLGYPVFKLLHTNLSLNKQYIFIKCDYALGYNIIFIPIFFIQTLKYNYAQYLLESIQIFVDKVCNYVSFYIILFHSFCQFFFTRFWSFWVHNIFFWWFFTIGGFVNYQKMKHLLFYGFSCQWLDLENEMNS